MREVLDGARITDVAIRYGIDRRTVHRCLVRYATGGLGALADRSSKPDRCPHQIRAEVEAMIVSMRGLIPVGGHAPFSTVETTPRGASFSFFDLPGPGP